MDEMMTLDNYRMRIMKRLLMMLMLAMMVTVTLTAMASYLCFHHVTDLG